MSSFALINRFRPGLRTGRYRGLFAGANPPRLHDKPDPFMTIERAYIRNLALGRVTSTGHDVDVVEDRNLTVLFPVTGTITTESSDRELKVVPGQALIASRGQRRTRVSSPNDHPFQALVLLLDQTQFAKRAFEPAKSRGTAAPEGQFCFSVSVAESRIVGHLASLIGILADDLNGYLPVTQGGKLVGNWAEIVEEKLSAVFAEAGIRPSQENQIPGIANLHVRRALEYMHEHSSSGINIAEVAESCGISVRTLELSFKKVLNDSPAAMLSDIKLDAARQILLLDSSLETVTDAALRSGFGHLGRFAFAYRNRFGELPSETLSSRRN